LLDQGASAAGLLIMGLRQGGPSSAFAC